MTAYTPDQLREIDALVAEHVMGWDTVISGDAAYLKPSFTRPQFAYHPPDDIEVSRGFSPSSSPSDAWLVETRMDQLARYCGNVVVHRDERGVRGLHLRERYTLDLLRITNPSMPEYEVTTMSPPNELRRRFSSDELWNLLRATPLQRCLAALKAVGHPWAGEVKG